MNKIIVTGCSTGVGKTVVSSVLATAFEMDYWKPIQSGIDEEADTETVRQLVPEEKCKIFPSSYEFKAALSPHHAARLEGLSIDSSRIQLPHTKKSLVVETAGGVLVPLNQNSLALNLFQQWQGIWVVVSRNYLGSINHTLLTIEVLKQHHQDVRYVVFNGAPNPDSEEAILRFSKLTQLGRLLPEPIIDKTTITKYANQWKKAWPNFPL